MSIFHSISTQSAAEVLPQNLPVAVQNMVKLFLEAYWSASDWASRSRTRNSKPKAPPNHARHQFEIRTSAGFASKLRVVRVFKAWVCRAFGFWGPRVSWFLSVLGGLGSKDSRLTTITPSLIVVALAVAPELQGPSFRNDVVAKPPKLKPKASTLHTQSSMKQNIMRALLPILANAQKQLNSSMLRRYRKFQKPE